MQKNKLPHWLGSDLLACRESKGITIKTISEATRIKQSVIRAIEGEFHEVLPTNPVVLQSFRHQIAKYLGLEENR
jgi:cytoskeletal protein RodZ